MATRPKISKKKEVPEVLETSKDLNPEKHLTKTKKPKKSKKKAEPEPIEDTETEKTTPEPMEEKTEDTPDTTNTEDPKKTNVLAWTAGVAGGTLLLFLLFSLYKKRDGNLLSALSGGLPNTNPKKPTPPKENKQPPPKTVLPQKNVTPAPDPLQKKLSEIIPIDPFWFRKDGVMIPLTTYGNVVFLGRKQYNITQDRQKLETDLRDLRAIIPAKKFMVAIQLYNLPNSRAGTVNQLLDILRNTGSVHSQRDLFWGASERKAGDPPKWHGLTQAEKDWFESYSLPYKDE